MSEAVSGAAKAPGSIQVIERMMSLLDALAASPDAASLKQLALATELHPSTAHRILAAMSAARFVERQDAGTYRLGIRLLELGNIVKSRINVREVALPFMQELHEKIGEAINLGARHDDEIVYLERTSSGRALVRVVYLVGGRAPLHLTSLGKLFLATDGPQKVREYAKRTGLPGKTPHSLTTLAALEKELDKVRRHGIAYDDGLDGGHVWRQRPRRGRVPGTGHNIERSGAAYRREIGRIYLRFPFHCVEIGLHDAVTQIDQFGDRCIPIGAGQGLRVGMGKDDERSGEHRVSGIVVGSRMVVSGMSWNETD